MPLGPSEGFLVRVGICSRRIRRHNGGLWSSTLTFLIINGVSAFFVCLSDLFVSENMHKDENSADSMTKSLRALQSMGFADTIQGLLKTNMNVSVIPTSHFFTHCSLNPPFFVYLSKALRAQRLT